MKASEYQQLAMRTNDGKCADRLATKINECILNGRMVWDVAGAINACLGLSGEVGEINDMLKKWVYHGHCIDFNGLKKELGDVLWYVAMMCESFNFTIDEVMELNIDKLKKRYPDGFSEQASINREE